MSAVQAVLLRKYLYDELASEMLVLKNEQQLLKTWRTQQGMTGEASDGETDSEVALQLQLAKESIVSVAMKLHAKVRESQLSTIWAKALREVLGENFLTDNEAKQMHMKAWETDVQIKIDRRATMQDEYEALTKPGTATEEAVALKLTQLNSAIKGTCRTCVFCNLCDPIGCSVRIFFFRFDFWCPFHYARK